jgi:hypothetical protein
MLDCKLDCVSGTVIYSCRIGTILIIIEVLQQQDISLAAPVSSLQERLYRQKFLCLM